MADIARLVAALELQSSQFQKELQRANNAVERFEKRTKRSFSTIGTLFKGFVGFQALSKITREVNDFLSTADHFKDFGEQVDISVGRLVSLSKVAEQAGVSQQELETGLIRLARAQGEAAEGSKETLAAFDAIGISAKDLKGLKIEELFDRIADRLGKYEDGANKVSVITQVFGKGLASLIPLLNQGSEAIKQQESVFAALAKQYEENAGRADNFGDRMTELKAGGELLRNEFVIGLLPALEDIQLRFLDSSKKSDELQRAMRTLGGEVGLLGKAMAVTAVTAINLITSIGRFTGALAAILASLGTLEFKRAGAIFEEFTADIVKQGNDLLAFYDLLYGTEIPEAVEGGLQKAGEAAKQQIEITNQKIIDAAQKVKEALSKASVRLIEQQAEQETALLERANKNNLISFSEYYNKRAMIQAEAINAEIEAQQKLLGTDISDPERVTILNEIELLTRKRNFLTKETVADIADSQREINDSLKSLEADLLEAQDDTIGATVIRLELQYSDTLDRMKAEGKSAGIEIINNLFDENIAKARLQKIQSDYSEFQSRLSAQQDVIQAQQETGLISERKARKEIITLQKGSAAELQKLIQLTDQLATETGDPKIRTFLLQLNADYERLANTANESFLRIKEGFEQGIVSAFEELGPQIETGIKAFDRFANSVIGSINRIAAEITASAITDLLTNLFAAGSGGGGAAGGSAAGLFTGFGLLTPRAHGGPVFAGGSYVVGEDGPELFSPSSNGRVTPNNELGGNITTNIYVSAPSGRLAQESLEQVQTRVGLAVRRATRRNA